MIDNALGQGFDKFPVFNKSYIKQNNIKRIKATYFYKRTGDVMRDEGEVTQVHFDRKGQLVTFLETKIKGHYIDTLENKYEYSPKGLVTKLNKKDGKNYKSTYYIYDTLGNVIKEEYHLERKIVQEDGEKLIDSLLDYETMRYKLYPTQRKKIVYNSYGNPYLDVIYYFNKRNQIAEIDKKLKMTSEINETKFFYNENNQVDSTVRYSSLTPTETESVYFHYDINNNLLDTKLYVNKKLIYHVEFIYNEKTGLLSSILKQEIETNFLSIIRFETTFFD